MLDNKTLVVLKVLLYQPLSSLYELAVKTKISKVILEEHLQDINDILQDFDLPVISYDATSLSVPLKLRQEASYVESLCRYVEVSLSQRERLNMIYLYTFCRQDYVSNNHYQDLLKVSRNTTLTDIKALRFWLSDFDLELDYSRSQGYRLLGREVDKERLALCAISELLQTAIGDWALHYIMAEWQATSKQYDLEAQVLTLADQLGLTPLQDRLQESLYFLEVLLLRYRVKSSVPDFPDMTDLPDLQQIVDKVFETYELSFLSDDQLSYLKSRFWQLLLGCFEGDKVGYQSFFTQLTEQIIGEMERLSLLTFEDRESLRRSLQKHLVPAYYRLTSRLVSSNSYTETIKTDYAHLFWLVKKALRPLELLVGYPLPDSEVSYFVIHFGGYLKRQQAPDEPYKAVIVCPNGVSTSLILKEELQRLFSNIDIIGVTRKDDLDTYIKQGIDMVFSTISLTCSIPHYFVSPMMAREQQQDLLTLVQRDFPAAVTYARETDQLLKVIKKYGHIADETGLREALTQFLQGMTQVRKDVSPLLQDLITQETYQYSCDQLDWRSAIRLGAKPLLNSGKIEPSYIEAMIDKVETFGPFIDLGKGIAIPHARPEDGAKEVGMSMLVLDNPIYLADDPSHEIKLLICISAIDNTTHLKALSHLTKLLRQDEVITALKESKQFSEIKSIIQEEEN